MSSDIKRDSREEFREKINVIDDQLSEVDAKLKSINASQDNLSALQNSINKCAALISKSLDPAVAKTTFEDLMSDNQEGFNKAYSAFEAHSDSLRREVNDLQMERENIIEEYEKEHEERQD